MTEQRTFKWGDQEYLVDDLLKLHAEQENNYYNFARDKGKYNNEALTGLKSAVTNRINSVKNGETFDADGTTSSDKVDNAILIPIYNKTINERPVAKICIIRNILATLSLIAFTSAEDSIST